MNALGYSGRVTTPVGPVVIDLPLEQVVKDAAREAQPIIRAEVDAAMARATSLGVALGVSIIAAIGVSTWYIASLHKR